MTVESDLGVAAQLGHDLRDLGGVRVLLETHALRESIANGDDDWEAGIIAAFHRLTRAQERLDAGGEDAAREWEERNRRFTTPEVIGQLAERDGDSPYWSAGGGDRA